MSASVAEHWSHERFAENLVNASHERELLRAGSEWMLEFVHYSENGTRCNLCNRCIKSYVMICNTVTKNRLLIGEECYDKLRALVVSGRVESQLPDRKKHLAALKKYIKKVLPDDTVLGWLIERLERGSIPANLVRHIELIVRLGFAPTFKDADAVVEYYKATRLFPIEQLIPRRLVGFRHSALLPMMITINQKARIESLLSKDARLRAVFQNAKLYAAYLREQVEFKARVTKEVSDLEECVRDLVTNRTIAAAALSSLLAIIDEFQRWERFQQERYHIPSHHESWRVAFSLFKTKIEEMLTAWHSRFCWFITKKELVVFYDHRLYVDRLGEWYDCSFDCFGVQPREDGAYYAQVLSADWRSLGEIEPSGQLKVRFQEPVEREQGIRLHFNRQNPDDSSQFIAMADGKPVYPLFGESSAPGFRTCYVLFEDETGKYVVMC